MIRTTAVPRTVRVGAAAASVAGLALLAGCAGQTTTSPSDEPAGSGSTSQDASAGGGYTDGTYTADGSYQTPESVETISVTITLESDVVTDVEVTGDPQARESQQYQGEFIGGIADEVVGKNIDDIQVDRVGGSSLTSGGFNQALEKIRDEAAS
ncbi:FMN-binding protein [Microbacterium sp. EYE_5]|uniref:FMN-binding protein n=1 Tax=unclassified Microbacterium TaxID=2609290 RepID=UPI002003EBA8|nr:MULTISPECIES: FMN-binding protein [unclassified Microbacterium]MCK6081132.1 FMN-binding protein [Microbacterium sp. EYE_382]MCK6086402.1 FMN-binding protein [Microbacterium sp. EYE_384]MCK6124100.1 FMN-binding protein [Microbacterium sp. EYE_80]MCK6127009.1 FMN-binding protein [Microbacterium sp. EYE_79]MCK6142087.1 FMN-binding protein [Microbacterium sp. EYE_39]